MLGRAIKVWNADNYEEPEEANATRYGPDPERAATEYAERVWSDLDHPDTQTILVRDDAGALHEYVVTAEPTVYFRATRIGSRGAA